MKEEYKKEWKEYLETILINAPYIVKIGNHKDVVKFCEPNIIEPFRLTEAMVIRALVATRLLTHSKGTNKEKLPSM